MKERLMIATAVELQLNLARSLLEKAVVNLKALKHGVRPALIAAEKALQECTKANACTQELLERIPEK